MRTADRAAIELFSTNIQAVCRVGLPQRLTTNDADWQARFVQGMVPGIPGGVYSDNTLSWSTSEVALNHPVSVYQVLGMATAQPSFIQFNGSQHPHWFQFS
jgi:hypothetical protein